MKKKYIIMALLLLTINIEGREEGVYFLWESHWGPPYIVAPINEKIGPLQVVYIDGEGKIHQDIPVVILVDPEIVNIIIEKIAGKTYVCLIFQEVTTNLVLVPRLTGAPPAMEIFVYPNPWKSKYGKGIIFKGLPVNARIRIFNIAGEEITELYVSGEEAFWIIPEELASGVYIALITNKGYKAIRKIGIIK